MTKVIFLPIQTFKVSPFHLTSSFPGMTSGNRGSSCCRPATGDGYLGLVLSSSSFWLRSCLVWILPLGSWPHWSAANLAHPLCSGHGQCSIIAAGSFVISPQCCWEPISPGFSMGHPILQCGHPPPPPTHKWLCYCSQLCRNHQDCGGRWLLQAPFVSSPDL